MLGFNYRMTDIQAAVGRVQTRPAARDPRPASCPGGAVHEALRAIPGLEPPSLPAGLKPNYQSYPVRVTADFPLGRDELMQALLERGVSTRRGIMNAHQEPAYADLGRRLPCSEAARDQVVLLPLYDGWAQDDQEYVIDCLRELSCRLTEPRCCDHS